MCKKTYCILHRNKQKYRRKLTLTYIVGRLDESFRLTGDPGKDDGILAHGGHQRARNLHPLRRVQVQPRVRVLGVQQVAPRPVIGIEYRDN